MADALHAIMEADRTVYLQQVVNRLQDEEQVIGASEHWPDDRVLPPGPANAQTESDTGTEPGLRHLSIWTSASPAPENAIAALLMSAVRMVSYCEPVAFQPEFEAGVTRYQADFPDDIDLNVLAAATQPGAAIEISLTAASGEGLPIVTADEVSGELNGVPFSIPRAWSLARRITNGRVAAAGMPVGGCGSGAAPCGSTRSWSRTTAPAARSARSPPPAR